MVNVDLFESENGEDIVFNVDFVGNDGSLVYNKTRHILEITMHARPFNVNHMSALTLAAKINETFEHPVVRQKVTLHDINEIHLNCCWGASGGMFSTAQLLSTQLNRTVRAYESRYRPPGAGGAYNNKPRLFSPREENTVTRNGHRVLHGISDSCLLPLYSMVVRR